MITPLALPGYLRAGRFWLPLIVALTLALLWAGAARADTPIEVTTTTDGIGVSGCSLREAVQVVRENAANDYGCGVSPDPNAVYTINLAPNQIYTLTVSDFGFENDNQVGDLDIFGVATIQGGAGAVIDANEIDRALDVFSATSVITVADVTIQNGLPPNITSEGENGGGIRTDQARLNLLRSTLTRNEASDGEDGINPSLANADAGGNGGAIYSAGPLYLEEVVIVDNEAGNGGDGHNGDSSEPAGGDGGAGGAGGGVYAQDSVTIINSTIESNLAGSGGEAGTGSPNGNGGLGGAGGGVYALGDLTIYSTTIELNLASFGGNSGPTANINDGPGGNGGGLHSFQSARLDQVTIHANAAGNSRGAVGGDGGGIHATNLLTLTNSTLSNNASGVSNDNSSGDGAGLFLSGASRLSMTGTTVTSNTIGAPGSVSLPGDGAGLAIINSQARIYRSSFGRNTGAYQGGAIFASPSTAGDDLQAVNSTFYENEADDDGGGLYVDQSFGGTLLLTHTTVASNVANGGDGGGVYVEAGALRAANSIFDGNTASGQGPNCYSDGASTPNADGQNLFGSASNCSSGDDITNTAALLGAPTNGYIPLLPGSPALNVLSPGAAGCGLNPPTDQRGVSRPQFGACDLGAYEAAESGLTLSKTTSLTRVQPGQTIMYTVTVQNNSSLNLSGAVLTDTLPPGLNAGSVTRQPGGLTFNFSSGRLVNSIGSLATGQAVTFTYPASATLPLSQLVLTNTAEFMAAELMTPRQDRQTIIVTPNRIYLPLILAD